MAATRQSDTFVAGIRDVVLGLAGIRPGDVVVDVASRDGFMGLRAAELVGPTGLVVFTEASAELLETCRRNAEASGVADRCRFLQSAPDDYPEFADGTADVVIMRSVLNYVPDKQQALTEYHRMLRPGGRLGFVQMFARPPVPGRLNGYDVASVEHLAVKVRALMIAAKPATYRDFDERQLLDWVEGAGFREITFRHETHISDTSDWPPPDWELAKNIAAGPDQPTLGEAIEQALEPSEAAILSAHLKQEVEAGRRSVRFPRSMVAAVRTAPLDQTPVPESQR